MITASRPAPSWVLVIEFVWLLAAYLALVEVPSGPHPGHEPAWYFLLTFAATQHLQWGRDLNFPLGPLGYLAKGAFLPRVRIGMIAYALAAPAALLALTFAYARTCDVLGAAVILVVAPFAFLLTGGTALYGIAPCAILALAWAVSRGLVFDPRVALGMGVLLGFAALVKIDIALDCAALYVGTALFSRGDFQKVLRAALAFTIGATGTFLAFFDADHRMAVTKLGICAASAAIASLGYALTKRLDPRRHARELFVPAACGAGLAATAVVIADQNARTYFRLLWELLRGYSSAMSSTGDPSLLVTAVAIGLATLCALALFERKARGFAVGLGLVMFLAFKHGFVRADAHTWGYFVVAAIVGAVAFTTTRYGPGLFLALLAAGFSLKTLYAETSIYSPLSALLPARVAGKLQTLSIDLAATDESVRGPLSSLRVPPRVLATLSGSVAALPWDFELPYANGLRVAIAPVPQLLLAYTAPLDKLDAAYFTSDSAPANVLLGLDPIDGRHPFAEAPSTTAALWCLYRSGETFDVRGLSYVALRRDGRGCSGRGRSMSREVSWDEPVFIPAIRRGEAVRVYISIHESFEGIFIGLAWKPAPIMIRVSDARNASREYRILPGNAEDGIILQPPIVSIDDLRSLFGKGIANGIIAVRVISASPWQYQSQIQITYEKITRDR